MESPLQTRLKFFPLPFHLTHGSKEKEKEEKKYNLSKIFYSLDSELMGNTIRLLKEILYRLKPDKCALKGKLGFSEPHLNGYLTALIYMM